MHFVVDCVDMKPSVVLTTQDILGSFLKRVFPGWSSC